MLSLLIHFVSDNGLTVSWKQIYHLDTVNFEGISARDLADSLSCQPPLNIEEV